MVVVISLAESKNADQIIVSALIAGFKAAISESRHVADRIDRPGNVVDEKHWHIKAPQHPRNTESKEESGGDEKMRDDVESGVFPQTAIPDFSDIGGVTFGAVTKTGRLAHQPHHVGVRESVHRTVNVFVGIRFQMVVTMVAYPHDRIAGERHSRASGKKEFEPLRHFEAAMSEISMQIERRTDSTHEKDYEHDG